MAGINTLSAGLFDSRPRQQSQTKGPTYRQEIHTELPNDGSIEQRSHATNENPPGWVPRPKRIACVICRKRKLRCDGNKPSCGTCSRLGHDCAYDEVRKKSGPKRGYVKQLEARLAQVETLLKTQDTGDAPRRSPPQMDNSPKDPVPQLSNNMTDVFPSSNDLESLLPLGVHTFGDMPSAPINVADHNIAASGDFSWEMIGLGLEEPLPSQEVIDELNEIYFRRIHPSLPMIHKPRFYAAMNLAPSMRPPVCLRYTMWALASCVTDKYQSLHPHFYQRARKYADLDEMKGLGEGMVSVAVCQTWILIGSYEFRMMYFPRAWNSTGKSMRLAMMLGLHRQDGVGLDVKQCLPPPRDWTEREERRRTFWVSFCQDRYASVGTGWPMMCDERDVLTNLPASDDAFLNSRAEQTPTLSSVMAGENFSSLSPLASIVLLACLFGRNLHHLHRMTSNDKDHDLNGAFWKRHRALDNIILNTSLSLPTHLRLPDGLNDPSIVFANMCIHTSTICLHQAAIFKAEKNNLPGQIAAEGKRRSLVAADQITNIMKMVSHTDLTLINPFLAFCLYVACRVFLQYLKSRPEDESVRSSLQFLLAAMNAIKHRNPLTESFLMQLDADLEGSGLDHRTGTSKFSFGLRYGAGTKSSAGCALGVQPQEPHPQAQTTCNAPKSPAIDPVTYSGLADRSRTSTEPPPAGRNEIRVPVTQSGAAYLVPGADDNFIKSMVMEIDLLTDTSGTSDRNHHSSDHPTPSTNQSSNSSSSPSNMDQPSPSIQQKQQQQQEQQAQRNPSLYDFSPSEQYKNANQIPSSAAYANYFAPETAQAQATGFENPFAFPAAWDLPVSQPQTEAAAQASTAAEQIPNFDNISWAPTSDNLKWDNFHG
ncbi:hypothetical protein FQN51_006796 [Onygenales sp. PD_10]|nr:hypothetical protein FQN51_006796 [Onygenales sp. PD_10]